MNYGARVTSNNPVQVDIFSGDVASNYESRDSGLMPTSTWASRYYTPVSTPPGGTGDARTAVWLYNPGSSSITVTYQRRNALGNLTTSNITVPGSANAGGYYKQILENPTAGTGASFYTSGALFYAYSTTDLASTTTTSNQAWDWSFTMIPEDMLTTQALVGLGIGRDPTSATNPLENGNPVWVTTRGNGNTAAPVYVDWDGDPTTGLYDDDGQGNHYDAVYNLRELDQAKVYVPTLAIDATSSDSTNGVGRPADGRPTDRLAYHGHRPLQADAGECGHRQRLQQPVQRLECHLRRHRL